MKRQDYRLLGILLLFHFLLFLPALFEPVSYGDECIYLTLGNAFRQGLVFYRDIHDNKPPLLYLVAALTGGRLFWFRLVSFVWNSIHLIVLYQLIRLFTKKRLLLILGTSLFILLYLNFEGRVANGEVFMMMPVTLAVFLLLSRPKTKTFSFGFLLGLLFSLGFLFKVPVFFDFWGIVLAAFFLPLKKFSFQQLYKTLKNSQLWGMMAGFALPVLLSIVYYATKDAFTPYVRSALLQNIGYLSSWEGSNRSLWLRSVLLVLAASTLFYFRQKISFPLAFFTSWFIFALFGALLSGRPYTHYLIEIVPSLTLLIILSLVEKRWWPTLPLILLLFLVSSRFWWYSRWPNYRSFWRYVTRQINQEAYFAEWGERTVANYRLAKFINQTLKPEERVFVWGDAACVYAISQRLPPGRYTVNYHIFDFNGFRETLEAIQKVKPRLIVKLKEEKRPWPALDTLLEKEYYRLLTPQSKDKIFMRHNHQE